MENKILYRKKVNITKNGTRYIIFIPQELSRALNFDENKKSFEIIWEVLKIYREDNYKNIIRATIKKKDIEDKIGILRWK